MQHALNLGGSGKNNSRKSLWEAWDEFCETIVPDDIDGPLRLRNSIRPASFLNIEDLGFGPGPYRILPNTFVSAGLFLTFIGLVAALHQFAQTMTGSGNSMDTAMQDFMQIASAKFIMSLVGLLCSIMFTVLLRARSNSIDRELHKLCIGIERRLVFVSLEDIGFRQLDANHKTFIEFEPFNAWYLQSSLAFAKARRSPRNHQAYALKTDTNLFGIAAYPAYETDADVPRLKDYRHPQSFYFSDFTGTSLDMGFGCKKMYRRPPARLRTFSVI